MSTLSGRLPEAKQQNNFFLHIGCYFIPQIVKVYCSKLKSSSIPNDLMLPFSHIRPLEVKILQNSVSVFGYQSAIFFVFFNLFKKKRTCGRVWLSLWVESEASTREL
jgi:hypothetical protein